MESLWIAQENDLWHMPQMTDPSLVTRFAPSPNGQLHLGHAYSAIVGHDRAKEAGGQFLLRIEDIDGPRSRPEHADEFRRDLEWLGLEWIEMPAQSTRLDSYAEAAAKLVEGGFLYPCSCTRREVAALPHRIGEDGLEYPGSCRATCEGRTHAGPTALRLDVDRALAEAGEIVWTDESLGSVVADPRPLGDVVLVRKDLPASYNLAVTLDDAADGVTLVTRGKDLIETTNVHRVLQELLGLPVPDWFHHALLLDDDGDKLAKRRGSAPLADRRARGDDGRDLAERLRAHYFELGK